MGSARRKSPTPPAAKQSPTIHTPGWCVYNPDDDTDDDIVHSFPDFDTSDANYTRLHQQRADYERQRWQQWDAPVSNPRRKSSKPLKPIFPTPMECGYYLHTALANIARAAAEAPPPSAPKTFSTEHALVVEAFSSIENVFNAQIQRLSQHLAAGSQSASHPKGYTVRSPSDKQLPLAPNVDSALRFFMHISAHVGAQSRSMLTKLSHLAEQLDPQFKPNPSALSFSAIHNHFSQQDSAGGKPQTSAKSPSARSKSVPKPLKPNMAMLAQEIRQLIPERYSMLKSSFMIHPAYRLEGNNRTLLQIANCAEQPEHFRPPSPPPSPPPPHVPAKRTRAPVSKPARKSKRARQLCSTPRANRASCKSSPLALPDRLAQSPHQFAQSPHAKRVNPEPTPAVPPLPLNRSYTSPPPKPLSPPFRTSPHAPNMQSCSPRHPIPTSFSAPLYSSPPCVPPAPSQITLASRPPEDPSSGKHPSYAPVIVGLPPDARQKLRENVKRRLTHVKTEEDEYEMRAYEIDEDESVEYVNSRSSPSLSMYNSPSLNDVHNDAERCNTKQRITFHQVIDVDEPEEVKQPMVVDLDG